MRHVGSTRLAAGLFLALAAGAHAAPCDRLNPEQRKLAGRIEKSTYPYDCCDETLDRCLRAKKVCKLARRLRDHICRMVHAGKKEPEIKGALERRARSMTAMGKKSTIDLARAEVAGDLRAPVSVVAYACARCPFCSKVVPDLYRMVSNGPLKGKAKLYFRVFPIRGHKGSLEGGLAFMAAGQLGKFWPYLLRLYGAFDSFSVDKLGVWASAVGIDRAAFEREMKQPTSRQQLLESKKEGLRNGVKATPTLFINGRQYFGDLDHATLLDVLDEEADRVASKQYCGK